jgi:PAS domain S-box-containing protein
VAGSDAILAATADAVVAPDRDRIIRIWDPGAERIFGHQAGEALGPSRDHIIPERLRPGRREGFDRVMVTDASDCDEGDLLSAPGIREDGHRISLEFTTVPLKDEQGQMQGIAAVMQDVTSRIAELKSLKQRLAATAA